MKKNFGLTLIIIVLIAGLMLVGCSQTPAASASSAAPASSAAAPASSAAAPASSAAASKLVVGFSNVSQDSPFYGVLTDGAKATIESMGATCIVVDAQNDIKKQNNDIADLVNKKVNAMIINPVDPQGVTPSLTLCAQNNIPVFTVDRPVSGGNVVAHVGRDNTAMGKLMGDKAVELLGGVGKAQGKVLEVMGDAGGKVMEARSGGFHEAVDKEPGIKVIQTPYCDYVRSKAVTAVMDIIQANKDFNLVYAHNDDMAVGAYQVLQQNNMTNVKVLGVDGLMEAVKLIADPKSTYEATTINDPIKLGQVLAETVMKSLNGEKVDALIDAGTGVIDKANAASFIDDTKTFAPAK